MAFRRKNLKPIAGVSNSNLPRMFVYQSGDTNAEILTANYFGSNAIPSADVSGDKKSAANDRPFGLRDAQDASRNDMKVGDIIFGLVNLDAGPPAHNVYRCSVSSVAAITVVLGDSA